MIDILSDLHAVEALLARPASMPLNPLGCTDGEGGPDLTEVLNKAVQSDPCPAAVHRVTPECQPVFPCWVYNASYGSIAWFRVRNWGELRILKYNCPNPDTHWSPDSPRAPTITPENK